MAPGQSINRKLVVVILMTTVSALLMTALALAFYDLHTFRQSLIADLSAQADILGLAAAPALDFQDKQSAQNYLGLLQAKPRIVAAAIYTSKGGLFANYKGQGERGDVSFPEIPESDGHYIDGNDIVLFKRIVSNGEILGTVYARARYAFSRRLVGYIGIAAVIASISLTVSLLMSRRFQRSLTEPIQAITSVARDVVENRDFSARAPKTSNDEIGVLVDAFNGMLAEIGNRTETLQEANHKLARTEERLRSLNAELEQRVLERTSDLEAANKDLEGFSYSVSHDLRAPIRAIKGFCTLLEADHGEQLDDEARRKLGIVKGEADRMGRLIDDLLSFSRLGRRAIQPAPFDMAALAKHVWQRLQSDNHGKDPAFRLGSLPGAYGDERLLDHVWTNLFANAIKFSSNEDQPEIEVGGIVDKDEYVYFVRDNGAGFDPKYADRLFGVFQRLHDDAEFAGTGVGLALVHKIVTRHGGRVWGDSKPGAGATFYFTLPKEESDERV